MFWELVERLEREIGVIKKAPTITIVCVVLGFVAASFFYSERIAALIEHNDTLKEKVTWAEQKAQWATQAGPNAGQLQGSFIHLARRMAEAEIRPVKGSRVVARSLIPAGSSVFGVFVLVKEEITGATGMDIGTDSSLDTWGKNVPLTRNTMSRIQDFQASNQITFFEAVDVVVTAVGGEFTDGALQIAVFYDTAIPNAG